MEPNSFGKKLGIGVRVAGRIARDRATEAKQKAEQQTASQNTTVRANADNSARPRPEVITPAMQEAMRQRAAQVAQQGRNLGQGIGRGSRNFGQSFFRPFAHASSVLWLEITGCFFALFAAFFGQNVYHLRAQYAGGPAHRTFELYCFLTAVFVYFSASSFLRARVRSRRQSADRQSARAAR